MASESSIANAFVSALTPLFDEVATAINEREDKEPLDGTVLLDYFNAAFGTNVTGNAVVKSKTSSTEICTMTKPPLRWLVRGIAVLVRRRLKSTEKSP
jgi:hypothetical protein